jgi:alanine racemase
MTSSAPGRLTIDLDQIAANWRALARHVAPSECGAVVKADAYGLGADRVVPALVRAGAKTFFVATPDEAQAVRALAPAGTIYALDGVMTGSADALLVAGALPVLSSLAEVHEWAALAARIGAKLGAALHLDSGLNRLGLSSAEVGALAQDTDRLNKIDLRLIMSHLASADDPTDPKNEAQRHTFDQVRAKLPPTAASLAASDGLMLGQDYHYDLVRPGYGLYGGQAFRGGPTPVKPTLRLETKVLTVRDVAKGETVGYSGAWRATRASRIRRWLPTRWQRNKRLSRWPRRDR